MNPFRSLASFILLVSLAWSGYAQGSDYQKLTGQEKADLARFLGWVWGDGRPGYDGTGIIYKGGNRHYRATVDRLANIRFDGRTNPFGFPTSGDRKLTRAWNYWDNSLPGGNPGDPAVLRDAIRHPNFLAGILEGEGQIFHSDATKPFYVADQSYAPSHPDRIYDIANFGPERMVQLFRLLADTYGFHNPSISIGNTHFQYNTQFCQAVDRIRTEYNNRKASNERGNLVSGFTVKVHVNPQNFNEIRNYGYFQKVGGKYRTPAPDSRLRIIRSSFSDQNTEARGPLTFLSNNAHSDRCGQLPAAENSFGSRAYEVSRTGSPTENHFKPYRFNVSAGQRISANVTWNDARADVRVYLRDANGNQVARSPVGARSASLSTTARTDGRWSVAIQVLNREVDYTVRVVTSR